MRRQWRLYLLVLSLGLLVLPSLANAQCVKMGESEHGALYWRQLSLTNKLSPARLLLVSAVDEESESRGVTEKPIVGFWRVKFLSKDNPGIPDGTVLDAGFAQWHATERKS